MTFNGKSDFSINTFTKLKTISASNSSPITRGNESSPEQIGANPSYNAALDIENNEMLEDEGLSLVDPNRHRVLCGICS